MKKYSYIIIDGDPESIQKTKTITEGFLELAFLASATNYQEALNLILEEQPEIIFLEIEPNNLKSNLSLSLINELHRYLTIIPKVIITTSTKDFAFEAIQFGVFDYLLKPILRVDLLKTILKLNKTVINEEEITIQNEIPSVEVKEKLTKSVLSQPLILCVKSYGDYRYLRARDISYFQADNNSTDIYLNTGEMVTAFKTLKHFESILSHPFVRIHNSYIINKNYISRIHSGNSVCYIKNSAKKIPFSKTYKSNIDIVIAEFAKGNYIEV